LVLKDGKAIQVPRQIKEHMLCRRCEERFGKVEAVVAPLFSDDGMETPALDLLGNVLVAADDGIRAATPGRLPVDDLIYFYTSVIWRASVARQATCSLNASAETVRRYLLGRESFPGDMHITITFYDDPFLPSGATKLMTTPSSEKRDGFNLHRFHFLGSSVSLFTDARPSLNAADFCAACSPERDVMVVREEGLIDEIGEWIVSHTPKGKRAKALARR
jgi:hypothetical protein